MAITVFILKKNHKKTYVGNNSFLWIDFSYILIDLNITHLKNSALIY